MLTQFRVHCPIPGTLRILSRTCKLHGACSKERCRQNEVENDGDLFASEVILHLGISGGAGNATAPAQRGPRRLEVVKVGSESAIAATVSPVIRIQQWYETRRVRHVIM